MSEPLLISADVVLPVAAPGFMNGAVVIQDDKILAVGPRSEMRQKFPAVQEHSHSHAVVVPGLVNAHTHLELSYLRGKLPASPFIPWVIGLMKNAPGEVELRGVTEFSVQEGVAESNYFGVTTVGDISKQTDFARSVLQDATIRAVSYGEIQALGQKRMLLASRIAGAANRTYASPLLTIALSPHAPYTVEGTSLQVIAQTAREQKLPVCMHLAELAEEAQFLQDLSGDIRRSWEQVGIAAKLLDDKIPLFAGGSIRWAKEYGLFCTHTPTLLAHVNYADDEELEILRRANAHVVYCPRTRHYFGHDAIGPHRWRDMLRCKINVCLGTDSLASNPDLSVLREAQFVLKSQPDLSADLLLDMITRRPAHALGLGDQVGTLEPGKQADLAILPLPANSVALASPGNACRVAIWVAPEPSAVYLAGKQIKGDSD